MVVGTGVETATDTARPFRWVGGLPCLDFNNTVGWPDRRGEPWPYTWSERLTEFGQLVRWAHDADLLSDADAARLPALAALRPDEAAEVLRRALDLREAIHWLLAAVVSSSPPRSQDLEIVNREVREGHRYQRLEAADGTFAWVWPDEHVLSRPLAAVAQSAADLLVSDRLGQLHMCAGDRCGWMFLNVSGRRRWCVMSDCGNRAKARRHYQRTRAVAG